MFNHTYKTIEILVPERRLLPLVKDWFDSLEDEEVKTAIRRIKWREMKPKSAWFRLYITSQHPNRCEIERYLNFRQQDREDETMRSALELVSHHANWIKSHGMPHATEMDGRTGHISWSPEELPNYDPESLPPQQRAQREINRQVSEFLGLVSVTAQSENEFISSVVGTNVPFLAAGLLIRGHAKFPPRHIGDLQLRRRFPKTFPDGQMDTDLLHDNILESPADFVILMRLAAHYGCEHSMVIRVKAAGELFLRDNARYLNTWLTEHARLESDDEFGSYDQLIDREVYVALDAACETYCRGILEAVRGQERDIPEVLNSFLMELPVPDSLLADDLLDDGDAWKYE